MAMDAVVDAEEGDHAALVLAADRQSLQLQVVKTAEEAAQVGFFVRLTQCMVDEHRYLFKERVVVNPAKQIPYIHIKIATKSRHRVLLQ